MYVLRVLLYTIIPHLCTCIRTRVLLVHVYIPFAFNHSHYVFWRLNGKNRATLVNFGQLKMSVEFIDV